ncbi:unnamed protein product [Mytilus edulis]|uniref:G-protein coupled receptors family 1 profile domain-containing protein n=1 Tax=Mytilus edulis TaxID=6550 RepID=A0A8S3TIW6_MYTED|nr:unnamed protein product [Mytilus edulis]
MCLHRLNATFTRPNRVLSTLTSNIAIGLGFVLVHVYVGVRCLFELLHPHVPLPCDPLYNTQKDFLLFVDVPNAIVVSLIACCYIVVICRIRMKKYLVMEITTLSETQILQQRKASLRLRYNTITLSCIIVVTACAILPRTIYGLFINVSDNINDEIIKATNNLILMNPLVDPFIYIFRIKEIRSQFVIRCFRSNKTTPTTITTTTPAIATMSSGPITKINNQKHN